MIKNIVKRKILQKKIYRISLNEINAKRNYLSYLAVS